jgi:hypothetical protein
MTTKPTRKSCDERCGCYARSTGLTCQARALANGRCGNHGGLSTGPKTSLGKTVVSEGAKSRYLAGHGKALKSGYKRWLESGGREVLSKLAKRRWRLLKALNNCQFRNEYARTRHGVKRLGRLPAEIAGG